MIKRTRIFDLDLINDKNFDETISSILNFNKEYDENSGLLPLLFTPNVDDVVKLNEKQYADLSAILKRSYYILPDGQPVIWASKLLGKKRRDVIFERWIFFLQQLPNFGAWSNNHYAFVFADYSFP